MEPLEPPESVDQKAVKLLNQLLQEFRIVRQLSAYDQRFVTWHDTTKSCLRRFLSPDSPHLSRFMEVSFDDSVAHSGYQRGKADTALRAALREIENFGVHVSQSSAKTSAGQGGVQQNFHGPVTIQNQAIATDNAILSIGFMGDATGSSLKEIAEVFKQSEELKLREVKEGLAGIEALAVEIQKPEAKRNWKSMLDCGHTVLTIADKATDLTHKLAPYLPAIYSLVERAKHALGS